MSAPAPSASERASAPPLGDPDFASLLDRLGPFEHAPRLAVAVSGGPDSMALCRLADRWARARAGTVVALTVDHGLRPEATDEAATVGRWLARHGIPHHTLTWREAKPARGIQAAARAARYDLLTGWCREAGVLHLLLAHHADDQAETVALRAARGSGPAGLAGMAAVREVPGLRLLRPLLGVARDRLLATLMHLGQPWLDDPSNRSPRFARSRLRLLGSALGPELLEVASMHGRARHRLDATLARWLARHARPDPLGCVRLDGPALAAAPADLAGAALVRCLLTVGGQPYPPRSPSLHRLCAALRAAPAAARRTLAGCRIIGRGGEVLVCRDPGCIDLRLRRLDRRTFLFDHRFMIEIEAIPSDLQVAPLGEPGWMTRRELARGAGGRPVPMPVALGLPALWRDGRLLAVPQLGLVRPGEAVPGIRVRFRPRHPLAGPAFTVGSPLLRSGECLC